MFIDIALFLLFHSVCRRKGDSQSTRYHFKVPEDKILFEEKKKCFSQRRRYCLKMKEDRILTLSPPVLNKSFLLVENSTRNRLKTQPETGSRSDLSSLFTFVGVVGYFRPVLHVDPICYLACLIFLDRKKVNYLSQLLMVGYSTGVTIPV